LANPLKIFNMQFSVARENIQTPYWVVNRKNIF
jgi:hypothetical protein